MPPSVRNERVESIAVERLVPHPANARRGDVSAIKDSILASGFVGAIIVQLSTMFVLAGNHTLEAAKELCMSHVPCVLVDVSDAEADRFRLAHNRLSQLGGYDDSVLKELLAGVAASDGGLYGTGYDDEFLQTLLDAESGASVADYDSGETGEPTAGGVPDSRIASSVLPTVRLTFTLSESERDTIEAGLDAIVDKRELTGHEAALLWAVTEGARASV